MRLTAAEAQSFSLNTGKLVAKNTDLEALTIRQCLVVDGEIAVEYVHQTSGQIFTGRLDYGIGLRPINVQAIDIAINPEAY